MIFLRLQTMCLVFELLGHLNFIFPQESPKLNAVYQITGLPSHWICSP